MQFAKQFSVKRVSIKCAVNFHARDLRYQTLHEYRTPAEAFVFDTAIDKSTWKASQNTCKVRFDLIVEEGHSIAPKTTSASP